jgi:hypothetical protein
MAFVTPERMPNSLTEDLLIACEAAAYTFELAEVLRLIEEFHSRSHHVDTNRIIAEAKEHLLHAAQQSWWKEKLHDIRRAEAVLELAWRWSVNNPWAPKNIDIS